MLKKLLSILLTLAMLLSMIPAGFAADIEIVDEPEEDLIVLAGEEESLEITVWVSDLIVEHTQQKIQEFNETQSPARPIHATVESVNEGEAYESLMAAGDDAPDLFIFPQDQMVNIARAGFLEKLDAEAEQIVRAENTESVARAAEYHGDLYAYPVTADNGFFMYYDKSVVPEADLDSLEAIIADCEAAGKTIWYEADSGWYLSAFFFGAGCVSSWEPDGDGWVYTDTFNSAQGLAAAKGLKKLTDSGVWVNSSDGSQAFGEGAAVLVSGTWNYHQVQQQLGENVGATDLPSFTVDGTDYHMGSFSGCKLLGVKPQEDDERRAVLHEFAQYLAGEEAQLERYDCAGWGPSNLAAQQDPAVQGDPALAALLKQSAYATPQGQIPGNWWEIARSLSNSIQNAGSDDELWEALETYAQQIEDTSGSGSDPDPAYASGQCGDDLTWVLDGNTLTISGTGEMWDYNWDNYAPWFEYSDSIVTIVIEEGVTSIGGLAFYDCINLTSVTIPEGVTSIGWYAFCWCRSLMSVNIPASVTNIGFDAFSNCRNLAEIVVAEGNQYYQSLDSVLLTRDGTRLLKCPAGKTGAYTVPDGVEIIEYSAFEYCGLLTAVHLPGSLREIRTYAFFGCSSLAEVTIAEGLLSIGGGAFGCTNLHEITFPASLQECQMDDTGDAVFQNTPIENIYVAEDNPTFCSVDGVVFSKDQSELVMFPTGRTGGYTVPESVTSLGFKAFDGVKLTEVILPESLISIGEQAFQFASALQTLTIPASVTTIGTWAFAYCGLTEIRFEGSAPAFGEGVFVGLTATAYYPENDPSWTEDVRQDYDGTITWVAYDPSSTVAASGECGDDLIWTLDDQGTLTISGTGDMWDYNWDNYAPWYEQRFGIRTLVIEDGATSVGAFAFRYCQSLTNVALPSSLRAIEWFAFSGCSSLTEIELPEGLVKIGGSSFQSTNLREITFPASLRECQLNDTGNAVFLDAPLENIFVSPDNPIFCSVDGVVFSKDQSELVMFPTGRTGSYTVPEGVTSLGMKAFDGVKLTEVILPEGLISIGEQAFQFARDLPSLTIPASVTTIGTWAFALCSLTEIRFEGSAPSFGEGVFYYLTATAYYPENDPSWTEDVMQNYGGTITWVPYGEAAAEFTITLTDYTKGAAQTSLDFGASYSGSVTFTVSADWPVAVAVKKGDVYTVLKCTTVDGAHQFTLNVTEDTELVFAFRGDVNLDGTVKSSEVTMIKRAIAGTYNLKNGMAALTADINGDGSLKSSDATMLARSIAGTYNLKW